MGDLVDILAQGTASGLGYALLGAGLILVVGITGRFHFAIGANFLIGAYAGVWVSTWAPWPLAVVAGVVAGGLSAALIEIVLYERVERSAPANALLNVFVVAFALMLLAEGAVRLLLPEQGGVRKISGFSDRRMTVAGVDTTLLDLIQSVYVVAVLIGLGLILARTSMGLRVRGVRSNRGLAAIQGINPRRVNVIVFILGCAPIGGLAVFEAMRTAATPTMGLTPAFYGFVIAFVAGLDRPLYAALIPGVAIGIAERWLLDVLTPAQGQVAVFGTLFVLLVLRAVLASRLVTVIRTKRQTPEVKLAEAII